MTINKKNPSVAIITRDGRTVASVKGRAVIALGTFDGVHTAHRELIHSAVSQKEKLGADLVGVWCFEESPTSVLNGEPVPPLTTKEEKLALLFSLGADFVAMGKFEDLCNMTADDFINTILKARLGCIGTVCGFNHRFGYKGTGTPKLLEEILGKENTVTVPEIKIDGETVSTTATREHLLRGEIEKANEMLGRRFALRTKVTEGKKLGRKIGFPTANQRFSSGRLLLKRGVYATLCRLNNGECFYGVSNVGIRPSIKFGDDHSVNCETYIIDFSRELYGETVTVEFCKFLREEKSFSSIEELTRAIENDEKCALEYFNANK